jgi:hypothetical protein
MVALDLRWINPAQWLWPTVVVVVAHSGRGSPEHGRGPQNRKGLVRGTAADVCGCSGPQMTADTDGCRYLWLTDSTQYIAQK